MTFINQHSFTLVSATALLVLAAWLLRDGFQGSDLVALAALGLGLGFAFALLNPGPSTQAEEQAVLAQIGAGVPVLLEFQSLY